MAPITLRNYHPCDRDLGTWSISMCLKCREWKLDNWITIIRFSLLFCPNYSLFILNFFCYNFIIHFFFIFTSGFLFRYSLSVNYGTKEVKTVIVVIFDSITKEENRTVQKRGKNLEIKQYMEFMLSAIFYYSILWLLKDYIQYTFNPLFSK